MSCDLEGLDCRPWYKRSTGDWIDIHGEPDGTFNDFKDLVMYARVGESSVRVVILDKTEWNDEDFDWGAL